MSDAPVLLVLHALRLRSFATAEVVAERFGMDLDATQATLALERGVRLGHVPGRPDDGLEPHDRRPDRG